VLKLACNFYVKIKQELALIFLTIYRLKKTILLTLMKKIFKDNNPIIGAGIFSPDQFIAKRIFQCDPDWLWICLEHSPWSLESMAPLS